jgi:S-adenosylmethionine/arginine decarboxylase-like enzyme
MAQLSLIQGPHCIVDFRRPEKGTTIGADQVVDLVIDLVRALGMKRRDDPRLIAADDGRFSVYQIVATSHIIVHFATERIHADLFSCEPFDVDACVDLLSRRFDGQGIIQYCQRNLRTAPGSPALRMKRMNALTSNPATFTHALINWYGGDAELLSDAAHGTRVVERALAWLAEGVSLPSSETRVLTVDAIAGSWDEGGISGGYVNLMRQLTIHTFRGINAAYTDVMAHCFDLEKIVEIIREGFGFRFHEVDAVFQRS